MIKPDWKTRLDELTSSSNFSVVIHIEPSLRAQLTREERMKLAKLTDVVEQIAQRLCKAALKGTLKYDDDLDSVTSIEWLENLTDDLTDSLMYAQLVNNKLDDSVILKLRK